MACSRGPGPGRVTTPRSAESSSCSVRSEHWIKDMKYSTRVRMRKATLPWRSSTRLAERLSSTPSTSPTL